MELQAGGTTLHESECGGGAVCGFEFVHGWMFTKAPCPSPWGVTLLRPAASIPTGWEGIPLAWPGGAWRMDEMRRPASWHSQMPCHARIQGNPN